LEKESSYWPNGIFRHLTYPEIPVHALLASAALTAPQRNAIIFAGMEITYAELDRLCNRFASALARLGVEKGDRVAIHLPNCPHFAIAYYGLLKAGAVFVPVSPLLSEREIEFQLRDAGAKVLITLDLLSAVPKAVLGNTPVQELVIASIVDCYPPLALAAKPLRKMEMEGGRDFLDLLQDEAEPPVVVIDPRSDLAHLSYTGGTTGSPKGVMLTHFNVVANSCQFARWFAGGDITYQDGRLGVQREPGDTEDRYPTWLAREISLGVVPWFHAFGTIGYLNTLVIGCTTMVIFARFDPTEYLRAIEKYRATVIGGAPQLFIALVEHPLFQSVDMSGLRLVVSGAAPISPDLLKTMREKTPAVICEGYGLTEATMGCTETPPFQKDIRLGSVGIPVADTEIKILDPESGEEVPLGEPGEICMRGPQVMKGYWRKPEETAQVLKEGWLHTGDIGRLDSDGYLFIVDRLKDMILYKGYNVYPRELEEVLDGHPLVQQSAVVDRPDPRAGEIPVAFVTLKEGASLTVEGLMEFANSRLAGYKKIREVYFVDSLPVNLAGKVLRRELREMLRSEGGASPTL
jgi:long-chain acyl-CoA synthetase